MAAIKTGSLAKVVELLEPRPELVNVKKGRSRFTLLKKKDPN